MSNIADRALEQIKDQKLSETTEVKHYASKYYDPVKAKEYYERTKKLKGRQKGLSTDQRETWQVSKANISAQRKAETDKNRSDQKAKLEQLRSKADAKREAISKKLTAAGDKLRKQLEDLADQTRQMPINKIPENASPKMRAFLEKQNRNIREGNAAKANKNAKALAHVVKRARAEASEQRKAIGDDLRKQLGQARTDYKGKVEATRTKYKQAEESELKNIRSKVK